MKPISLLMAALSLLPGGFAAAQEPARAGMMQAHMRKMADAKVDVPVMLKEARVVFRIDRIGPSGDNSFVLQQIGALSDKLGQMGANTQIVAVFNGDGGFMLLNDMAYDAVRKAKTGNPYKGAIADLLARGVEVEECGMTMMREGWAAKQLLPAVKVNSGANLRIIDLSQKGYVILNQ